MDHPIRVMRSRAGPVTVVQDATVPPRRDSFGAAITTP
jgi:hypothetical protein